MGSWLGERAGPAVEGVTQFLAPGALSGLREGEHLLHSSVAGEKVDHGENCFGVGGGDCDNNRGSCLLTAGVRVWVEVTS